jgi:Leucine-rich repeat (LRR) protein
VPTDSNDHIKKPDPEKILGPSSIDDEGPAISPKRVLWWLVLLAIVVFASTQFHAAKQRAARAELEAKHGATIEEIDGLSIVFENAEVSDLDEISRLLAAAGRVTSVDFTNCPSLTSLEGISRVRSLRAVMAVGLPELKSVGDLSKLKQLRVLELSDCSKLADIEGISGLVRLETLNLSGALPLTEFDGRRSMPELKNLYLSGCSSLRFVNVTSLTSLRQLGVEGSSQLTSILGLDDCPELTDLFVTNCHNLRKISGLPGLRHLAQLDITDCVALNITGLLPVDARLDVLRVGGQPDLADLFAIGSQTELSNLQVEAAESLTSLSGMPDTPRLKDAGFTFCPQLTNLENITAAPNLARLSLTGCTQLSDISPLKKLGQLQTLELTGCTALVDGSVLLEMPSIEILQIGGSGLSPEFVEDYQRKFPDTIVDTTSTGPSSPRLPMDDPSPLFIPPLPQ